MATANASIHQVVLSAFHRMKLRPSCQLVHEFCWHMNSNDWGTTLQCYIHYSTLVTPLTYRMFSSTATTWWNSSSLRGICPLPSSATHPLFIGSTWRAHRDNSNNNNTFKAACRSISSSTLYRLTGRSKASLSTFSSIFDCWPQSVEPLLRTVYWMLSIQHLRGWPGGLVLFGCQWSSLHYLVNVRSAFFFTWLPSQLHLFDISQSSLDD